MTTPDRAATALFGARCCCGCCRVCAAPPRRILGWLCISAVFWIAGGLAEGHARLALWASA
ncbi:hypothetical protein ISX56_35345, partial [Serratia ureilytica]|nr:hypothetical protein [Serratia ureilytica]